MNLKKTLVLLVTFMLIIVMAGCNKQQPVHNTSGNKEGVVSNNGQAKETDSTDKANWPRVLVMGTASVGGTYYIYGSGWGDLVSKATGVNVSMEVTGGPNHNIQLIETGEAQLGMVTLGPAYEAWNGLEEWTGGKKFRNFRVIFPMYQTYFHWWSLADSGIKSVSDFRDGSNIGVGPSGGTAGTYFPRILKLLETGARPVYGGNSDLASQVLDGLLPAVGFTAGLPISAVSEAEAVKDINIFGFEQDEIDKIINAYSFFKEGVIPADTYRTLSEDVKTVTMWNMAIASKDLPDSLVYQIVDSIMSQNDEMIKIHSAAVETIPENIKHNILPMHPGAIKWFEDHGYELPREAYE